MRAYDAARRVLAGTAAMVLLVGCSGGPGESDTSSSSSEATSAPVAQTESGTESTAPTATPPAVEAPEPPPEMAEDSTVGATATVWYFLKLYDYMGATGDTSEWERLSSPDCEWCANIQTDTETLHDEGGWIESPGLQFDITAAEVEFPQVDHPFYTVRLAVTEPAYSRMNGDGTSEPGSQSVLDPFAIGVQYINGGFVVIGVNFEEA